MLVRVLCTHMKDTLDNGERALTRTLRYLASGKAMRKEAGQLASFCWKHTRAHCYIVLVRYCRHNQKVHIVRRICSTYYDRPLQWLTDSVGRRCKHTLMRPRPPIETVFFISTYLRFRQLHVKTTSALPASSTCCALCAREFNHGHLWGCTGKVEYFVAARTALYAFVLCMKCMRGD